MYFKYLSEFLIIVIVMCTCKSQDRKLHVSIYYETLCPDSKKFIIDQFYPTYSQLRSYFRIDLLPYGKATHKLVKGDTWNFECQHGPNECYGNKLHACVLMDKNVTETNKVEFINCFFQYKYSIQVGPKCAAANGIDWKRINVCSRSKEVNVYMANIGNRTHAVQPKIKFIPTIVFDGIYNKDDQCNSITNFKRVLCSKLNIQNLEVCEESWTSWLQIPNFGRC